MRFGKPERIDMEEKSPTRAAFKFRSAKEIGVRGGIIFAPIIAMAAPAPHSIPPSPPEIDFAKAFKDPHESANPLSDTDVAVPASLRQDRSETNEPTRFRTSRLGRSDWTNIIFVANALIGGLFCAFYFYNGADLLRSTAHWPDEFFYGRSLARQNPAPLDLFADASAGANSAPIRSTSSSPYGPFSRTPGVAAMNQPPSPATLVANNPSSSLARLGTPASPLLDQLPLPAPGGGALAQAFNKGIVDVQTAAALDARRVVTVIQTGPSRVKGRIPSAAKHVVMRERERITGAAGPIAASGSSGQTSPRVASANTFQNQTSNALRSTTNNLYNGLGHMASRSRHTEPDGRARP